SRCSKAASWSRGAMITTSRPASSWATDLRPVASRPASGLRISSFMVFASGSRRGPSITDQEGIGMHRGLRLVEDSELAAPNGPANARPQIRMPGGGVDRHRALGRLEARAEHHGAQHIRVMSVRLLERLGEHVNLKIGGLDAHIGRLCVPVAL